MSQQQTVRVPVSCRGVGLHTGKPVTMTLRPAPVYTGIIFRRLDLGENVIVEARPDHIADAHYATSIRKDGVVVKTIEHLMATLAGLRVDNVIVELNNEEVPAMDGSAGHFVELVLKAGLHPQTAPRAYIEIKKLIAVDIGDRHICLVPSKTFQIIYTMAFDHPLFGEQTVAIQLSEESFSREIAWARTYGFLKNVGQLRREGLAKGGSLDNAVIIDEGGIFNGKLRSHDELVRHKILDLLGDLYLLGRPLLGTIIAYKAGHLLHTKLVQEVQRHLKHGGMAASLKRWAPPLSTAAEPVEAVSLS